MSSFMVTPVNVSSQSLFVNFVKTPFRNPIVFTTTLTCTNMQKQCKLTVKCHAQRSMRYFEGQQLKSPASCKACMQTIYAQTTSVESMAAD